jgi:hypothetical protein
MPSQTSAPPARVRLSGTRRGRFVAVAFTVAALAAIGLYALGVVAPTGYVVLDAVVDSGPLLVVAAVVAGVSIGVAGWLVFGRGPAAIVVRILTCLLAVAVVGLGGLWGLLKSGFSGEILSTEVVAVSPDGRHEVILRTEKDYKGGKWDVVRLRSRAGLLSREADTDLVTVRCVGGIADAGRMRVTFTADRQVTFEQVNGPAVAVTFDDALRPTAYVSFCP